MFQFCTCQLWGQLHSPKPAKAMETNKLSDVKIRAAKPQDKLYSISDGEGMFLEISPKGGKWWRFKYRFNGKQKRLSLGTYPSTSLKAARDKRQQARELLASGVDPGDQRKALLR